MTGRTVTLHTGIKARILRFNCELEAQQAAYPPGLPKDNRRITELFNYLKIKYPYLRFFNIQKWVNTHRWITNRQGIPPGVTGQKMWKKVRDGFAVEQAGRRLGPSMMRAMTRDEIMRLTDNEDEDVDVVGSGGQPTVPVVQPGVPSIIVEESPMNNNQEEYDERIRLTPELPDSQAGVATASAQVDDSMIVDPFGENTPPELPQPMDFTPLGLGPGTAFQLRPSLGDQAESGGNELASDPIRFNDRDLTDHQLKTENIQQFLGTSQTLRLGNTCDQSLIGVKQLTRADLNLRTLTSPPAPTFLYRPQRVSDTSNIRINTRFEDLNIEEDSSITIVNSPESSASFIDIDSSRPRPGSPPYISIPLDSPSSTSESSIPQNDLVDLETSVASGVNGVAPQDPVSDSVREECEEIPGHSRTRVSSNSNAACSPTGKRDLERMTNIFSSIREMNEFFGQKNERRPLLRPLEQIYKSLLREQRRIVLPVSHKKSLARFLAENSLQKIPKAGEPWRKRELFLEESQSHFNLT